MSNKVGDKILLCMIATINFYDYVRMYVASIVLWYYILKFIIT